MLISKSLLYSEEARKAIQKGADKIANAVKVTLGPKGRNVVFENAYLPPTVTKDGVTVARQIDLEDKFENIGCQMIKEVANKTVEDAGDGTTTATILAQAIFNEGLKSVTAGANPIMLNRGIEKAVKEICTKLDEMSIKVEDDEAKRNVAMIASNNDKEIADLVFEAIKAVGDDGVVTIEDSSSMDTGLDVVEGMQLNNGLISPYLITEPGKMCAKAKEPLILLCANEISNVDDIKPILEKIFEAKKWPVIIAENVSGIALSSIVVTKLKAGLPSIVVKAPGFGDSRRQLLEDIAIMTGTIVVDREAGIKLKDLELSDLGTADYVEATKDFTTIVGGGKPDQKEGIAEAVKARIEELKAEIEAEESDYNKEKLQERLAKLSGGVAVIKVGAATEVAQKEKKMRVEDALHATKAAVDEGIVAGGGIALFRCVEEMPIRGSMDSEEEILGRQIVYKAILQPLKTIVENAGMNAGEVIAEIKIMSKKVNKPNWGLDVLRNLFGDMVEDGIIDPTKVVKHALQNAASVAGLMLTTECTITTNEPPEDKYAGPPAPGRRA